MASQIDIYNMALGHLGQQQTVSSLTEQSSQRIALSRFYATARDMQLRLAQWPFARKTKMLSVVAEDPTDEWTFSYRYPNDCLYMRRIFSGERNDAEDSIVPYLLVQDSAGMLVYTDLNECQIEYTSKCDNTSIFPPDFVMALSALLASLAGPSLCGGDLKPANRAYELHSMYLGKAISNSMGEEKPDRYPDDSFTRSRG